MPHHRHCYLFSALFFSFLGLKGLVIYAQINTAVCPFAVPFFSLFNMQHTHKGPLLCTLSGWVGVGVCVYVLCVIQQPGFERRPQRRRLGEHRMDKPQSACLPCTPVMIRLKPYGRGTAATPQNSAVSL